MIMLMNPNNVMPQMPQMPTGQMPYPPKQSHVSFVVAILMTLCFVGALSFGFWAFAGMQENKSNLNEKIEVAATVAVEKAETAKEVEFAEREKDPSRVFTGPATYGSLSFAYPKTWSVLAEEKSSGTVLNLYAQPFLLPGVSSDFTYAFRVEILSSAYDKEVAKYSTKQAGKVTISAFRPTQVPSELGVRITGEVEGTKQGTMILLPLRDKTFRIWTESPEYSADFDAVIETLTFVP